jgi:hypothetical protein
MRRSLLFIALLSGSGCAVNAPMRHIVVDQNTVLAKTTDEVMLVNLLRARDNEPMHFSLVSQFHGSATLTAGLTLGAAFPGTATVDTAQRLVQPALTSNNTTTTTTQVTPGVNTFSPSAAGSFSEMPSFDSNIVDSQSFFQGFLKPVSAAVVGHFLYDGWSPRLLTYLLVKRFELVSAYDYDQCGNPVESAKDKPNCPTGGADDKPLVGKGELVAYLDNNIFEQEAPDGTALKTNPFADVVEHFQITGVTNSPEVDAPLFTVNDVSTLSGLEKVDGGSFDVKDHVLYRVDGVTPTLVLSRFENDTRTERSKATGKTMPFHEVDAFRAGDTSDEQACGKIFDGFKHSSCVAYIPADRIFTQGEIELSGRDIDGSTTVAVIKTVKGKAIPLKLRLVLKPELRSPESVFYFVGEYLRKTSESDQGATGTTSLPFRVSQDWPWSGCTTQPNSQPLIVVTPVRPQHVVLSAELDGTRYYIPDARYACNGQSMKVLTLLEQLFYLQVSSSDKLGLTPTVHVVP